MYFSVLHNSSNFYYICLCGFPPLFPLPRMPCVTFFEILSLILMPRAKVINHNSGPSYRYSYHFSSICLHTYLPCYLTQFTMSTINAKSVLKGHFYIASAKHTNWKPYEDLTFYICELKILIIRHIRSKWRKAGEIHFYGQRAVRVWWVSVLIFPATRFKLALTGKHGKITSHPS